jgi:hypothetical protein
MTIIVFYFYFLTYKKINEKRKMGRKKKKEKGYRSQVVATLPTHAIMGESNCRVNSSNTKKNHHQSL